MGQTTEELRSQLEEQRADLTRDVQAIGDRVTPSRMVERRRAQVRQSFSGARERVMGSADQVQARTASTVSGAVGNANDAASSAVDHAKDVAGSVVDSVGELPDMARRQTQGAPLLAGVIAFGVGALTAALVPPSAKERDLAQRHGEEIQQAVGAVKTELGGVAHDVADQVTPSAQQAIADVTDGAKQAVGEIKSGATDASDAVREQVSSASDELKSAAEQG